MELLETIKQARDAMKQVDSRPNGLWNIKTELANLTTAIEQLEKAEPVAWMWKDEWGYSTIQSSVSKPNDSAIPLYTHPAAPVIDKSMLKRLVTQVFGDGYEIAASGEKK